MSASFRSTSHATATSVSTVTITKPAGAVSGDLLIYSSVTLEHLEGQSALLYDNSGDGPNFTSLLTREYAEPDTHRHIYLPNAVHGFGQRAFYTVIYKVAGGSEPSTYTFNYKTGSSPFAFDYLAADLTAYKSGYSAFPFTEYLLDTYDPNAPPQGNSTPPQTSWDTPGLPADLGEALLSIGYMVAATSASTTPPTGWTERNDNWQTGSGFLTTCADLPHAPSPAGGPYAFTTTVAGTRGAFVTFGKPISRLGVWLNPPGAPLAHRASR